MKDRVSNTVMWLFISVALMNVGLALIILGQLHSQPFWVSLIVYAVLVLPGLVWWLPAAKWIERKL